MPISHGRDTQGCGKSVTPVQYSASCKVRPTIDSVVGDILKLKESIRRKVLSDGLQCPEFDAANWRVLKDDAISLGCKILRVDLLIADEQYLLLYKNEHKDLQVIENK